ncbi:HAMP domain-containing sensor histidine kinase [Oscillospiraceae bacterium MB08-C2-2]|nr:HAMP domain-containing sensor histidine kinase [Oscillospiraceae bacterium MB08-C2-2]
MKRITKRWLLNNFGVIIVIILAVVAVSGYVIYTYYYDYVRQAIVSRSNVAQSIFMSYSEDSSTGFVTQIQSYVSGFADKAEMEMMALDSEGNIFVTSSGFEPDEKSFLPDYYSALSSPDRVGRYVGTISGQRVMAMTFFSEESVPQRYALRFVVALSAVDRQIAMLTGGVAALGVSVILLVVFSSSYFINSIVNPVGEIGNTARRIAQGDFAARLKKKTNDEIGELCDIINYMAEELDNSEKIKNEFISSVSHELRTPLTAIQGWAETILSDGGQDKDTLTKGMGIIIGETSRLSSMVEELLDFSRMASGRLKLILAKIDLAAELEEAVLMYTQRAQREGISLNFQDLEEIILVYGDKNRLRQVFINVIDNAVKYSDPGDSVSITVNRTPKTVTVVVADTGLGIKPEDLEKVKTKFYKGNFTRRGSGIGLAVADEIVTRHGGTLDIASRYGEGTRVRITLPLYDRSDEIAQIDDTQQQG